VPPPMPGTLAVMDSMTSTGSIVSVTRGSITSTPSPQVAASIIPRKPTSAVVNIAYAMQYKLAPEEGPVLKKEAKIGIGVGAAAGGIILLAMIAFLVRRCTSRKRTKIGGYENPSASQRFSSQVDMSRVAHEPAGVARTHGGVKYAGVSTRAVGH
jgi:hypothetical protein